MRTESTGSFTLPDGTPIRLLGWPSPVDTDVAVVIHHGLGEHAGRYASAAAGLEDSAAHIWSWDARGHGESGGKRGHADSIDQLVDDLEILLPAVIERSGAERVVLWGHSLGGSVVGRYLTRRKPHPALRGAWISSSPMIADLSSLDRRVKAALAPMLARLAPRLTLPSGLDTTFISSVPAEVERYLTDPLVHDRLSAGLGNSMLAVGPQIVSDAARIQLPFRVWHGTEDRITVPRGSQDLFTASGSEDKTLELIDGARHEVHHETPAIVASLFAALRAWLTARVPA